MKYDVKIHNLKIDGAIKAYATVVINDELAVEGIKVMSGKHGAFITMPQRRMANGEYRDTFHPITKEAREELQKAVISAYELSLKPISQQAETSFSQQMKIM